MHVFVAGATGVLGKRLVDRLTDRGHAVTGLTRDEAGAAVVRAAGGTAVDGDLLDSAATHAAVTAADPDVIIHAATAIPAATKTTAADWEPTNRLRREGTENLLAAAVAADADRYLQQSVVWVARQPDGSGFDEDSEPHPDRTTQAALDGERLARDAGHEHDLGVTILRCGWFYGADAAHTRLIAENLRNRRLPIIGSGLLGRGDAELSPLHADDAARAFVAAVGGDATGLFHVVDDETVTAAKFFRAFADRLDAPTPHRIPSWLARPLAGRDSVRFFTRPMPTSNDRFRAAFDWAPELPTYREGLDRVVAQMIEEGRDHGETHHATAPDHRDDEQVTT
ncbi:NAD-dependent epimerase/dehydratase family protein [Haloarchaeobius sp. DFWS5]|uniref:NAD-dependent epimerase/dehydratase family protein n=1 Tax=Haloarchaeobius sp. DFWS5 TaxID=3446114 RepID=UPI003EC14CE0